MRVFFWFTALLASTLVACSHSDSPAEVPGSLANQYKQMGSIAGVAERCYGSKAIPEAFKARAASDSAEMRNLIKQYNDAYYVAIEKQVVWNGTKGAYGKPFDCTSASDMQLVKQFEQTVVSKL